MFGKHRGNSLHCQPGQRDCDVCACDINFYRLSCPKIIGKVVVIVYLDNSACLAIFTEGVGKWSTAAGVDGFNMFINFHFPRRTPTVINDQVPKRKC